LGRRLGRLGRRLRRLGRLRLRRLGRRLVVNSPQSTSSQLPVNFQSTSLFSFFDEIVIFQSQKFE
jgi:hypothetical protein